MRWMFVAAYLALSSRPAMGENDQGAYPQQPPMSQWQKPPAPPQIPGQAPGQPYAEDTTVQSQPHLGIVVMGLTRDLRGYFGAPVDRGVLVAHVESNSIAQRAGLQVGDVIIRIADRPIVTTDDVIAALDAQHGGRVQLHVIRGGAPFRIDAMFPERPTQL